MWMSEKNLSYTSIVNTHVTQLLQFGQEDQVEKVLYIARRILRIVDSLTISNFRRKTLQVCENKCP